MRFPLRSEMPSRGQDQGARGSAAGSSKQQRAGRLKAGRQAADRQAGRQAKGRQAKGRLNEYALILGHWTGGGNHGLRNGVIP